jgi:hypothetical protein
MRKELGLSKCKKKKNRQLVAGLDIVENWGKKAF